MIRLVATLVAVLLLMGGPAHAQDLDPIELPRGNTHAQDFQKMRYLLVEPGPLDAETVLARKDEFQQVTSPWIDFGDQDGSVWVMMRVINPSDRAGEWMIDIQRPFVDELVVLKSDGPLETLLSVDQDTAFSERPVTSQYLVAPLRMDAGESADILVGMKSTTGSWMPLTFATPERMRTAHMQEARVNWIINGAILALMIVALAMGRLVGWPLALGFAGYVGLSGLFVANNEGYLHRFVFTDAMWLYQPLNLVLLSGMMLAVLQFARLFAGLAQRAPRFNRFVLGLQAALLGLAILGAFLWQSDEFRWVVFALVPPVAISYFITAWIAWRSKVLGALPFLAGSVAILFTVASISAVLLAPGVFPMTVALDYFHTTLLFEALAFFIAILVRMLAMQADLNRSLEAEVVVTREKLELAEQLQASRQKYDVARDRAEGMRARLASTSHDLQQPMIALRQDLQRLAGRDEEAAGKLATALDYLEAVTASGLEHSAPEEHSLAGEKPDEGAELFPARIVLDNCATMFRSEARAQGVELHIQPTEAMVHTDPVALMRAVSNLLSNALKHAGAKTVSLSATEQDSGVVFEVRDDGKGMSKNELEDLAHAYSKGSDSDGHGLGLALVHEFASTSGHGLTVTSEPGDGANFALQVPRA